MTGVHRSMMTMTKLTCVALLLVVLGACDKSSGSGGATPVPSAATAAAISSGPAASEPPIVVSSSSFLANGAIPALHGCDGANTMPALSWTNPPNATAAQALIVEDPDAPAGTFTHLVAWNMSASSRSIGPASSPASEGGQLGKNDFGKLGWGGPCPPKGKVHHYRFRVFALDKPLTGLKAGADRAAVDAAMKGHVLAEGVVVGTFER